MQSLDESSWCHLPNVVDISTYRNRDVTGLFAFLNSNDQRLLERGLFQFLESRFQLLNFILGESVVLFSRLLSAIVGCYPR